jgi:2,4-dienoyl-CoA reductase-like NADH-dependent reductase (Old Yellow Enzyme family)
MNLDKLFSSYKIGSVSLSNRVVMSPMTRCFSPNGVPGQDVADYYRRRAEGGVGLIITEGTHVPHPGAANDVNCPDFYGKKALLGWSRILHEVHSAGGKIMPQLWHVGLLLKAEIENLYDEEGVIDCKHVGPSGYAGGMKKKIKKTHSEMSLLDIQEVVLSFERAASSAYKMGFDGIEIHAAHGYLIDQFFWSKTNRRKDRYGYNFDARQKFAEEIIIACRRVTSPDFPILMRISQWKGQDYGARLAKNPKELELFLAPLVDAGVDLFDCSQRRFWETEFKDSDLSFSGWVKNISGKPTMTVGSVGLDKELIETLYGAESQPARIDKLLTMLESNEFDLVAVGRALLVDPEWTNKIKEGLFDELQSYNPEALNFLS